MAVTSGPAAGRAGSPAGQASWPVRSGAVPPLADGFVARPETAPGLGAALVPGATVALVPDHVISGTARDWLGSCGKTQLAVSCAESLWQLRRVELLIWVDASSRASALSGYVEAATAAMGTGAAGDAESVAARFLSWLDQSSHPWLVVLDDAADPADLDGLWPQGPAGRTLITSTSSAIGADRPEVLTHPVGAFSPREALSYLMGRLTADTDQRLGAIDLVEDLGREPLALTQASAVIAESALSCRDYRDYFLRRREQLSSQAADSPSAAAVTWIFSFEQVNRQSPGGDGRAMLGLAALLDGHAIPCAVLTATAARDYLAAGRTAEQKGGQRAQEALVIGERSGLLAIDRAAMPPVVRMSPVVQAVIRKAMPDQVLDRAARAAADALLEAWPAAEPRTWLAASLRSATASLRQAAGNRLWTGGCHPLLPRAGRSLNYAQLTGPAVAYWSDLAAVSDRVLGPDHPDTLLAGEQLAASFMTAGRATDAVPWLQWALARRRQELGPDHPDTVQALRNLGQALVAAGQFGEAMKVLRNAAVGCRRLRGPEDPETLGARDALAAGHRATGQFGEAIRGYQRTLADRERIQGRQHPDTMTTREKLAEACLADGRIKAALPHYKRVLSDREQVLGPDHLDTIAARGNLASAYHAAGRMASALRLYEQACESYERFLGPDHADTLARRASLARAYYAAGRRTDAVSLLRDTVARCDRVLPPGDPLTKAVRGSLASIAAQ